MLSISPRPDRQELESSLLQYPATFKFSDRFFEDKTKPEWKDLHPKRLSHSRNYLVLRLMKYITECIQLTLRGVNDAGV